MILFPLDFDFPKCPISMMNTRNLSKKEKDKLKKQQEKLDHALAMLQIEQYHFFHLIKEGPEEVYSINYYLPHCSKGAIIYFIESRSPSRHKKRFLHLADTLMEHFLEGSAPLRLW